MDLFIAARLIDLIGKILISYTAIAVHYRFRKAHKINKDVFGAMQMEQTLGLLGILLMVLAFVMEVLSGRI